MGGVCNAEIERSMFLCLSSSPLSSLLARGLLQTPGTLPRAPSDGKRCPPRGAGLLCGVSTPRSPPPRGGRAPHSHLAFRWGSSQGCSARSGRAHMGLSPRPHSDSLLVGTTDLAPPLPDVSVLLPCLHHLGHPHITPCSQSVSGLASGGIQHEMT